MCGALTSKYGDRPRPLFDAHSPRQPSVSPASPAFSAPESYFPVHASYLIICPRFTLGVAAVTEKNGGQTDAGRTHAHTHTHTHTHTHRQTDCNNPRCACAQARVNYLNNLRGTPPANTLKWRAYGILAIRATGVLYIQMDLDNDSCRVKLLHDMLGHMTNVIRT